MQSKPFKRAPTLCAASIALMKGIGMISWGTTRCATLASASLFVLAGCFQTESAAQSNPGAGPGAFSFDVYGDSRSMMYLPYKADQEADARKLMVDMFDLVLPEKVAEGVVQKYVKLIYDPSTHELVQVVMPFETKSE